MYHSEDLCENRLQEMNTSVALLNLTTSMGRGSSESEGGSLPPPPHPPAKFLLTLQKVVEVSLQKA